MTVDCGIRSLAEVDEGTALGLDMIVTDHHSVGSRPAARCGGHQSEARGRFISVQEFAGVGIAFKLAQALSQAQEVDPLPNGHTVELDELLDLVALGTVADLVPLIGENRILGEARAGTVDAEPSARVCKR